MDHDEILKLDPPIVTVTPRGFEMRSGRTGQLLADPALTPREQIGNFIAQTREGPR